MTLLRTWAALVTLSALTAALTALDPLRPVLVIGVLVLAGAKARLILARYLELHSSPPWHKGFDLVLTLLLVSFGILALAG